MKRKTKVKAKRFLINWKGKLIILIYSVLFFAGIINYILLNQPYFPADTLIGLLLLVLLFASLIFCIIAIIWLCLRKGSERAPRYFSGTSVPS
ncbi:hypothetical protein J4402_00515 [Candidatus Pacearchaeota archaeon]|nr:hypothetical protein [Candidatus Pacearchaeota archaeon]